jgi:hypothetical protein
MVDQPGHPATIPATPLVGREREQAALAGRGSLVLVGGEAGIGKTTLKVAGIDLSAIGRVESQADDETVTALEEAGRQRYRRLDLDQGRIAGAILISYPREAQAVAAAVKHRRDLSPHLRAREDGGWHVLRAVN